MQLKSKTSNGVIYLIGYPSAFDACPAGDVQIYVGRVAIRPETSSLIGALCFDGCFDQISFDGQISPQTRDVMMGCGIAVNENGVYDIPKTRSDTSDYSFVSTSPDQTGFFFSSSMHYSRSMLTDNKAKSVHFFSNFQKFVSPEDKIFCDCAIGADFLRTNRIIDKKKKLSAVHIDLFLSLGVLVEQ